MRVDGDLQKDFSLNHTLSLWLLDASKRLELASEGYALNVLSLVEAMLDTGAELRAPLGLAIVGLVEDQLAHGVSSLIR